MLHRYQEELHERNFRKEELFEIHDDGDDVRNSLAGIPGPSTMIVHV